jgi:hypothetical protein
LARQIGEYLVCAELGRRGLIATPFSGNVPSFDILAADDRCRTVPIQVKATRFTTWPGDARDWMKMSFDEKTQTQKINGPKRIENPDLIYVFVVVAPSEGTEKDRFFILTKAQLQDICRKAYSTMLDKCKIPGCKIPGKRPQNPKSYDCRPSINELHIYENNWPLISERLAQ